MSANMPTRMPPSFLATVVLVATAITGCGAGSSSPGGGTGGRTSPTGGAQGGVGGLPTGGSATGGVAATGGTALGGAPETGGGAGRDAGVEVCARWKADRADLGEGSWNGAVASCAAGELTATARSNALRLVNLYRWLAGLPAVDTDPVLDAQDQACALMMRANGMLNHMPPTTWTCYSADGAEAAGNSNISSGPAVSSVDLYMIDPGNATTLGHRRWLMSNSLGPIGIGGTDRSSCLWTLKGKGKAGKAWQAWPAPGILPLAALVPSRGMSVDDTGWSLQSDTINLASAQVSVTSDGATLPVTVTQLDPNYGARYALRFSPTDWKTQAGKTYAVSVTGVSVPIAYQVQVVSCP